MENIIQRNDSRPAMRVLTALALVMALCAAGVLATAVHPSAAYAATKKVSVISSVTTTTKYSSGVKSSKTYKYKYNGKGLLGMSVCSDSVKDVYTYNAKNLLTKDTQICEGTKLADKYKYSGSRLISKSGVRAFKWSGKKVVAYVGLERETHKFTYNAKGQIVKEKVSLGKYTEIVKYSYDSHGNLSKEVRGSGKSVYKNTYNANGRLVKTVKTQYYKVNGKYKKSSTQTTSYTYTTKKISSALSTRVAHQRWALQNGVNLMSTLRLAS